MNERIQELAKQADPEHWHKRWYSGINPRVMDPEIKKFVELIVRECVKEIEFQYGGGSDQPMDNEWDRAIECVSSMVKYRFGVEE